MATHSRYWYRCRADTFHIVMFNGVINEQRKLNHCVEAARASPHNVVYRSVQHAALAHPYHFLPTRSITIHWAAAADQRNLIGVFMSPGTVATVYGMVKRLLMVSEYLFYYLICTMSITMSLKYVISDKQSTVSSLCCVVYSATCIWVHLFTWETTARK